VNENGDAPTLTHEQQVAHLVGRMNDESDSLTRDDVLAETYLLAHRSAAFADEFRIVMQNMTSGKMGGIFGRLLGKANADADA